MQMFIKSSTILLNLRGMHRDSNQVDGSDTASLKGVLHLLPKISMFCALFQNNQQLFEI